MNSTGLLFNSRHDSLTLISDSSQPEHHVQKLTQLLPSRQVWEWLQASVVSSCLLSTRPEMLSEERAQGGVLDGSIKEKPAFYPSEKLWLLFTIHDL